MRGGTRSPPHAARRTIGGRAPSCAAPALRRRGARTDASAERRARHRDERHPHRAARAPRGAQLQLVGRAGPERVGRARRRRPGRSGPWATCACSACHGGPGAAARGARGPAAAAPSTRRVADAEQDEAAGSAQRLGRAPPRAEGVGRRPSCASERGAASAAAGPTPPRTSAGGAGAGRRARARGDVSVRSVERHPSGHRSRERVGGLPCWHERVSTADVAVRRARGRAAGASGEGGGRLARRRPAQAPSSHCSPNERMSSMSGSSARPLSVSAYSTRGGHLGERLALDDAELLEVAQAQRRACAG